MIIFINPLVYRKFSIHAYLVPFSSNISLPKSLSCGEERVTSVRTFAWEATVNMEGKRANLQTSNNSYKINKNSNDDNFFEMVIMIRGKRIFILAKK